MVEDHGSGFARYANKPTRRDEFLKSMDALVPWSALCEEIAPHYPKAGNGRPPVGLERMLRMYFVQHWFNLADQACEEALYDSASLRRFVGIDLGREPVPDATTLLRFRRLLETNKLGEALFSRVNAELKLRGYKVQTGTIVDATIIGAPSSTKNREKARDPEMHQTRKGQQWYFGMKLHIGVDSQTGLVHSARVTAANEHDKHSIPELLHGEERRMYGDSAYHHQKDLIATKAPLAKDFTNERTRLEGLGGRRGEAEEPDEVSGSREGGACLCGGEAAMGFHEGALSRPCEEYDAGIRGACVGESVHDATAIRGVSVPEIRRKPKFWQETNDRRHYLSRF